MKSRFVSTLSLFAILAGVFGILSSALQLLSYRALESQPEIAPILVASLQEKFGIDLSIEQIQHLLLRNGASPLLVSVLSLVIGIALKRRASWSRPASIYLIFFLTLGMVSSIVSAGYRPDMPLYWAGAGLTVLAVILHAGIIMKLRSPQVQAEFSASTLQRAGAPEGASTPAAP